MKHMTMFCSVPSGSGV